MESCADEEESGKRFLIHSLKSITDLKGNVHLESVKP